MALNPRPLLDPSSAAVRAIELIGAGEIADAVGKAVDTVRGWAKAERPQDVPNATHIKTIDELCMERAGEAPFADWLERCADAVKRSNRGEDLRYEMLLLTGAVGDLSTEMARASDPAGDGGADISPRELESLTRKAGDVAARLDYVKRVLATLSKPQAEG